ncbi:VWA domain-containing protein, partial [Planctomycetota bacterium]
VSGSMDQPNKLPLLRRSMKLLVNQLGENDRVAITVYAGAAGKVLESTTADKQEEILAALDCLHAGGSTNGGAGIHLAYQTALDNFIKGGVNRVILCTDGDFNVGTTGTDELVQLAEENAKTGVFLSVFGFGMGNHNDSMLEQISNRGNGNYGFIDNDREAKKSPRT